MAFRYRQEYLQDGDILDPYAWNKNMAELAEEWNGFLDRDNFPEAFVTEVMLLPRQCNVVASDGYGGELTPYRPSMTTSDWQRYDVNGRSLGEKAFTAVVDSLVTCEWGGGWWWGYGHFAAAGTWPFEWSTEGDVSTSSGGFGLESTAGLFGSLLVACCRYRLVVDGVTMSESGWFSWFVPRAAAYLVGTTPVAAGPHTSWVEIQVASVDPMDEFAQAFGIVTFSQQLLVYERELVVHWRKR